MVIKFTKVNILDNSGGLVARCFGVFDRKVASIGDIIIVSILRLKVVGRKVMRGDVYKAIVIKVKKNQKRNLGFFYNCLKNGVVLLKRNDLSVLGTRIRTRVPYELRYKGFFKVVVISEGVF